MRVESTKVVKKQKGEDIVKYFFKKDQDSNYFQCQYEGCNTKRMIEINMFFKYYLKY